MLGTRGAWRLFGCLGLVLLAVAACGGARLTREAAVGLIRPQIVSVATVPIRVGRTSYLDYTSGGHVPIEIFRERGIVREPEILKLSTGWEVNVSVDEQFRALSRTEASGRGTLVLATGHFGEITGLRESADGRSAEVEFSWEWVPNEAGRLMEGATFPRNFAPFKIALQGVVNSGKASCAVYDDGWRCKVDGQQAEYDQSRSNQP